MNGVDGLKAALLLFVAAIMQVSIFTQVHVLGGVPDLLLVMLVAVVTVLYSFGLLLVHFVLGERAPAGPVARGLLPAIALNLILTAPVYALVRRLLRPLVRGDYATEVQLLG